MSDCREPSRSSAAVKLKKSKQQNQRVVALTPFHEDILAKNSESIAEPEAVTDEMEPGEAVAKAAKEEEETKTEANVEAKAKEESETEANVEAKSNVETDAETEAEGQDEGDEQEAEAKGDEQEDEAKGDEQEDEPEKGNDDKTASIVTTNEHPLAEEAAATGTTTTEHKREVRQADAPITRRTAVKMMVFLVMDWIGLLTFVVYADYAKVWAHADDYPQLQWCRLPSVAVLFALVLVFGAIVVLQTIICLQAWCLVSVIPDTWLSSKLFAPDCLMHAFKSSSSWAFSVHEVSCKNLCLFHELWWLLWLSQFLQTTLDAPGGDDGWLKWLEWLSAESTTWLPFTSLMPPIAAFASRVCSVVMVSTLCLSALVLLSGVTMFGKPEPARTLLARLTLYVMYLVPAALMTLAVAVFSTFAYRMIGLLPVPQSYIWVHTVLERVTFSFGVKKLGQWGQPLVSTCKSHAQVRPRVFLVCGMVYVILDGVQNRHRWVTSPFISAIQTVASLRFAKELWSAYREADAMPEYGLFRMASATPTTTATTTTPNA